MLLPEGKNCVCVSLIINLSDKNSVLVHSGKIPLTTNLI